MGCGVNEFDESKEVCLEVTKKNINSVKFLKKIVKKKEREDKEWHPRDQYDVEVKKLFSRIKGHDL
jgi:hypothetical protein